jgi:hypothetical protein
MAILPFEPEPLESLQARFPKALERIWVVPSNGDMPDRPGMHREHLFDFESGLRLLISIDRLDKAKYHYPYLCIMGIFHTSYFYSSFGTSK